MSSTPSSQRSASANKPRRNTLRLLATMVSIVGPMLLAMPLASAEIATPATQQSSATQSVPSTASRPPPSPTTSSAPSSQPIAQRLQSVVPSDAAFAYVCDPTVLDASFSQNASSLVSAASMFGLFDINQQKFADTINTVLMLCRYPHAIVLMDVACKERAEGSFQLDRLSSALVVQAGAASGDLLIHLERIIRHYFSLTNATLEWIGDGTLRRQQLTATDLPSWAVWQWGTVGDLFIFTVGQDVYEPIAQRAMHAGQPTVSDGLLVKISDDRDRPLDRRLVWAYIDVERLGAQLRPVYGDYFDRLLEALWLRFPEDGSAEKVILSAGFMGRAFISHVWTQWPMGISCRNLTRAIQPGEGIAACIPDEATAYCVCEADVPLTVAWATESLLATRNPRRQTLIRQAYQRAIAAAALPDLNDAVLAQMGSQIVIHNYPKHPLALPFACTLVVEHHGGRELRSVWNQYIKEWRKLLERMNGPKLRMPKSSLASATQPADRRTPSDQLTDAPSESLLDRLLSVRLRQTEKGGWFLHTGPVVLAGIDVTDRYWVMSWSPMAVGLNTIRLDALPMPTSQPTLPLVSRPQTAP